MNAAAPTAIAQITSSARRIFRMGNSPLDCRDETRELRANLLSRLGRRRRERRTRIAPFISGEIEGGFQSRHAKARRHQSSEWCHFFLKLARFSMLPLLHRVEQPQADLWRNRRHRGDSADRAEAEIRIENGARAREHRKGGRHDVSKLREERRISA